MESTNSHPLSKAAHLLTKRYVEVLYGRLADLGVNRYLYVPVMIAQASLPLTQNCLARQLQVDKATIARMMQYLEDNGLITRTVDQTDKRAHLLGLTPAGVTVAERVSAEVYRLNQELAKASGVDTTRWLQQTGQLLDVLSDMPGTTIHPSFKHILSNPAT